MLYNLRKARQSRTASILSGSHSDSAGQRENDSSAISHAPPPNHIHKYGAIPGRSCKSPGLRHSFVRQSSQTCIHAMCTLTDRDIRVLKSRYPKK